MLERAAARATRFGLAARVQTRQLDLDENLSSLGRCDLAWAATAIHHADDEVATLRRIRSLLEPRGLVCVLERADPTVVRFADDRRSDDATVKSSRKLLVARPTAD